jgi:von Willebrand factor type A domain
VTGTSIPLADIRALAAAELRTRILRIGLALALAGTLAAAFLVAGASPARNALLPAGTSPVVVLDLSWSTSSDYRRIGSTLRTLAGSDRRIGLIVFSDAAYEMFPPGTPARELRSLLRFFEGPKSRRADSPWATSLSGGTRISSALLLARDVLHRERISNGSAVLVSDLGDSPNDRAALSAAVVTYLREGIPLRVVGIDPTAQDTRFFQELLGSRSLAPRPGGGARPPTSSSPPGLPVALFVLGAVFLLLFTVNEHYGARLRWSST